MLRNSTKENHLPSSQMPSYLKDARYQLLKTSPYSSQEMKALPPKPKSIQGGPSEIPNLLTVLICSLVLSNPVMFTLGRKNVVFIKFICNFPVVNCSCYDSSLLSFAIRLYINQSNLFTLYLAFLVSVRLITSSAMLVI